MTFIEKTLPIQHNNIPLHLAGIRTEQANPNKVILLVHGITYSSHQFDLNYKDYSLCKFLAINGYQVWRLDLTGYGQSGKVEDGFVVTIDYAAEDIHIAAQAVCQECGVKQIDLLGWSWGTVTTSRFAELYPELLRKHILYAPIINSQWVSEIALPYQSTSWAGATEDFQHTADGNIDWTTAEAGIVDCLAASCWRYDGAGSPNGGRKQLFSGKQLIHPERLTAPTLFIYGDQDAYLQLDVLAAASLPAGSEKCLIKGSSHVLFLEYPYYHEFQNTVLNFLNK